MHLSAVVGQDKKTRTINVKAAILILFFRT